MAMGLAVTWCDTLQHLMGRAALHQQGPNEVQRRFSPRDHDNVRALQHAICETTLAGHHLLSRWRVCTSRASNLRAALGWLWKISHQYHQLTFFWPWRLATRAQGNTTLMVGHRRQPCWTQGTGTCYIITGREAVMQQNKEHVLRGWLLTDDRGGSWRVAAVAFD